MDMNTTDVKAAQDYLTATLTDPPVHMHPVSGGTTVDGWRWVCLDIEGSTPYVLLTDPPRMFATPVQLDLVVEWMAGADA